MTELQCERLAPEAIDARDWDRLAEESRNLFATREFLSCWWRHFGQGSPEFTMCRDGAGRAVGLLPLYTRRRAGLTVARFAGHGPGDHLGPIAGREARPEVGAALRRTLADLGCDLLVAEHVPVDDGWQSAIGGHIVRDDAAPLITGESWESYSQSRSSHFRRKLRWQMRRLAQEGEVTMRLSDASTLERDLETLFRLHGTRWEGQTDFLDHAPFHREFAPAALERGWLRLWQLELDGETIASSYGFRFAGREWQLQTGRDPRITIVSAGLLLLWRTLELAFEDGINEYLLLLGDEDYKSRLATGDGRLETRVVTYTLRGRSTLWLGGIADRLGLAGRLARQG